MMLNKAAGYLLLYNKYIIVYACYGILSITNIKHNKQLLKVKHVLSSFPSICNSIHGQIQVCVSILK